MAGYETAYHLILSQAADLANHDTRKPAFLAGDFFRIPNTMDRLELWYTPEDFRAAVQASGADEAEVLHTLKVIVKDAIEESLTLQPDLIAALIHEAIVNAAS